MEHLTIPFELKNIGDDQDAKHFFFEGYASTFGNEDLVGDVVQRGAFNKSLMVKQPVLLWQHDSYEPIGVPAQISEDEHGLFLRGKLPKDDDFVRGRVMPQLKVGSIKSMSIGFRIVDSEYDPQREVRTLKELDLVEVSLVSFPANPEAQVTAVKQATLEQVKEIRSKRDFERCLRESGAFSKQAAVILSSKFLGEPENAATDEIDSMVSKLDAMLSDSKIQSMINKLES